MSFDLFAKDLGPFRISEQRLQGETTKYFGPKRRYKQPARTMHASWCGRVLSLFVLAGIAWYATVKI
jgi:hypothetical protein